LNLLDLLTPLAVFTNRSKQKCSTDILGSNAQNAARFFDPTKRLTRPTINYPQGAGYEFIRAIGPKRPDLGENLERNASARGKATAVRRTDARHVFFTACPSAWTIGWPTRADLIVEAAERAAVAGEQAAAA
jgi:hypothetical protein